MNSNSDLESPASTEAAAVDRPDFRFQQFTRPMPHPPVTAVNRRVFKFPLPFDPIRLLAGVISRWPIILICAILAGILGAVMGRLITKPSYALSVSLLKRKVPQSMQTGEVGQAYRPADLNDPTLLATLLAVEPLEKAAARINSGLDPSSARKRVEAAQQKGTDIYFITYHSPVSARDAVDFLGAWAEEINNYTKRLQQSDARGVREILQTEVSDLERQLERVNKQILDFSRDKQFLGTQTQVLASLTQLGQATLELENSKSALTAKDAQILAITGELQRQSPIESQLKAAREEVATLRATYTDENPLVKAKLQGIEYLEENLKNAKAAGPGEIESYTGTPIGNQLFLDILAYRNERNELSGKVETYTKLRDTLQKRVDEFPAIVSRYEELQKQRESLLGSHALLNNRLKETEIFASGSPGYWQVFQGPDIKDVVADSMLKKPALLAVVGGIGGAVAGVLLILVLTSRSKTRSVLECCNSAQAPFLIRFSPPQPDPDAFDRLWTKHVSDAIANDGRVLFWTGLSSPADERRFWAALQEAAMRDGSLLPKVIDLTPDGLWTSEEADPLRWTADHSTIGTHLYRASLLPSAAGRTLLKSTTEWFALATGHSSNLRKSKGPQELLSLELPPCSGLIAAVELPTSLVRKAADSLSTLLARHFSRPPAPITTHD